MEVAALEGVDPGEAKAEADLAPVVEVGLAVGQAAVAQAVSRGGG